jgi:outer membrane protein assembly factor BamD
MHFMTVALLVCALGSSACGRRKKYENPITKDTQQPDKVLFDKAINDIEKGRFEVARITLNTLINTYDTSEFLAKAKLAIADSWYREGGSHGLAQAEAEYKDFILFYPTMEEAAESQNRICDIHYRQMEKPDRDAAQAVRAEAECRQLITQFPNSKFAPIAEQKLRNIQEAIAEGEFRVGNFYHHKGSNPAAANRLRGLIDQYPLYSGADEALWMQADSYNKMGTRFRKDAGEALQKIVRDYPLSSYVDPAKKRLQEMEMPIPEADPVALNRMKFEAENRTKPNMVSQSLGLLKRGPDVSRAAKSGSPAMTPVRPPIPASIPTPAATAGFTGDVSATTVSDPTALDQGKEARQAVPANAGGGGTAEAAPAAPAQQPLPTNQQPLKRKQKKNKKQPQTNAIPPTGTQAPGQTDSAGPAGASASGPGSTASGPAKP